MSEERRYIKENKGHEWIKDPFAHGDKIDIFAFENGIRCNGPRCKICGYGFCHHCHEVPEIECPGKKGDLNAIL